MPESPHSRTRWLPAAGLAVVVALASWGGTIVTSSWACFFDTSECARTHEFRQYRGRVFDYEGRPAPRTALTFGAGLYGEDFELPFVTDDRGRFCVLAIPGRFSAFIAVPRQRYEYERFVRSTAPADRRFASEHVRERLRRLASYRRGPIRRPFIVMEPVPGSIVRDSGWAHPIGAHNAAFLWNEQTDAAPRCERVKASPPWYRFTDHTRSWQYAALTLAPLLTLSMFAFGFGARRSGVRKGSATWATVARSAFQATCAGGVASAVLFVVLWDFV
jgi:hypothetical protein